MQEELDSLKRHGTYKRVDELAPGRKAVGYKWVFKLKLNPDNSIAQYKARLVAKGYSQVPGQDFTETTIPVARLASHRALLSLAAKMNLEAYHLDIETAFLNGTLDEEIYMKAPDGFNTGNRGVWRLLKSLYGLKQVSHVWNKLLDSTLWKLRFNRCSKDTCVYLYRSGDTFIILAVQPPLDPYNPFRISPSLSSRFLMVPDPNRNSQRTVFSCVPRTRSRGPKYNFACPQEQRTLEQSPGPLNCLPSRAAAH
jgi:Reverse transcriptase (RNA-dependent DNA polymerase)